MLCQVASFPLLTLRAGFFTVLLVCMLPDMEEYMLMKFILLLKGSQAIAGILYAIIGMGKLWDCAVVQQPPTCAADGPVT